MSTPHQLISYFKDCYQADTRTLVVNNLFSTKIENRYFIEGKDELLNGNISRYPIPSDYAEEVEKNLSIYKKEKAFYCAVLSIIGKRDEALKKDKKICAPVFLYPAKLGQNNDGWFVEIDFEKRSINVNFLNTIKKEEIDDIHEAITEKVPVRFSQDIETISILNKVLDKRLYDFSGEEGLLYPEWIGEKALKRKLHPKSLESFNGFHLLPTATLCVMNRSTSTQGIIAELNELSETKRELSAPLEYILGEKLSKPSELERGWAPAILSEGQKAILSSVDQNTATLVIGPPGTGKSYSIAALALDQVSKGNSVLIASKTDQAVDVVHHKIEHDLKMKGMSFRAGKSEYTKLLKGYLESLMMHNRRKPKKDKGLEIAAQKHQLNQRDEEIKGLTLEFEELIKQELEWAEYVAKEEKNPSLFAQLKFKYIEWRISRLTPHWDLSIQLSRAYHDFVIASKEFVRSTFDERLRFALSEDRKMYRDFLTSLTARNSSRQDKLFEGIDLRHVLKTFPIWSVNMSDIYTVFPNQKEIFDVAIIDEATQCDIASCLPILQRAKRVVIVGDPAQLKHSSFLSRSMQYSLQKKHKIETDKISIPLDYRNTSILDLLDERLPSQDQVSFLDEHFRSKPDIISFSNEHFYQNNLRVMTDLPNKDKVRHRYIVQCGGIRDQKGINKIEAREIIEDVKRIFIADEGLPDDTVETIGILSPFRDQVEYIISLIQSEIDIAMIERHKILCGTAYSFQGEERDVMFISLAVDDESHHSAIIHMNKPEVFNVSMTRARSEIYIYQSFSQSFDAGKYVNKYLSDIRSEAKETKPNPSQAKIRDKFLEEVLAELMNKGFQVWVDYNIAGLKVDIVFMKANKIYGIDLIGYTGRFESALEAEDLKILMRAGLPVFPMPYTYWTFDRSRCFAELISFSER